MVCFQMELIAPSIMELSVESLDVIRWPGWGEQRDVEIVDSDGYDVVDEVPLYTGARERDEDYEEEEENWDDSEPERVAWERTVGGRLQRSTLSEVIQEAEDRREQAGYPRHPPPPPPTSEFIDLTITPDFEYIDLTQEESEPEYYEAVTGMKRPRSPRDPDEDGWIEVKRPKN